MPTSPEKQALREPASSLQILSFGLDEPSFSFNRSSLSLSSLPDPIRLIFRERGDTAKHRNHTAGRDILGERPSSFRKTSEFRKRNLPTDPDFGPFGSSNGLFFIFSFLTCHGTLLALAYDRHTNNQTSRGDKMNCRKCGGLMVAEKFLFTSIESRPWDYVGARCLCCGRIEDPMILAHEMRARSRRSRARG